MANIFQIIVWSCITIATLIGIAAIILWSVSAKNMKKRRETMLDLQSKIKTGAKVLCANGIYGKITAVDEEKIFVEIAAHTVITVSRYAIQEIVE